MANKRPILCIKMGFSQISVHAVTCFITSTVKTWSDAKAACQADKGALASINNLYESGFVVTVGSAGLPFWIGLSDSVVSKVSSWSGLRLGTKGLRHPVPSSDKKRHFFLVKRYDV